MKVNGLNKRIISGLLCFIFMFSVFAYQVQADDVKNESVCEACVNPDLLDFSKEYFGIEVTELKGEEANEYLDILGGFKNLKKDIKQPVVIQIEPMNIIFIVSNSKVSSNSAIYAAINSNNKEIIKVSFFDFNADASIKSNSYNGKGELIEELAMSQKELKLFSEQREVALQEYMENSRDLASIEPPSNWEYWCCQFAGQLACSLGCVIFVELPPVAIACKAACSLYWSNGVCDAFKW